MVCPFYARERTGRLGEIKGNKGTEIEGQEMKGNKGTGNKGN
jgi:hypothetical protein